MSYYRNRLEKEEEKSKNRRLGRFGATVSVFQGSIGEYLGIPIESGEGKIFQGIGGKIIGYIHEVDLEIEKIKFPCKIAFSNELATSLNILGRDNFFEKFLITFNEADKILGMELRNQGGHNNSS